MRWGVCTTVDNLGLLEELGYDFIELTMVSLAGDRQYDAIRKAVSASNLQVEAFNVLLPGEMKIVGPEVDYEQIHIYLDTVFPRAAALGGKVIVLGSGRSRSVPPGFPRAEALRQVTDFGKLVGQKAEHHDLVVGIEPLRQAECNLLNYVSDAFRLAEQVASKAVGITADLYHMVEGNEPLQNVAVYKDKIYHVHLADTGRMWPGSGMYDYLSFFRNIKKTDCIARMSVECKWDNFPEEAARSLDFLKRTWETA